MCSGSGAAWTRSTFGDSPVLRRLNVCSSAGRCSASSGPLSDEGRRDLGVSGSLGGEMWAGAVGKLARLRGERGFGGKRMRAFFLEGLGDGGGVGS